MRHERSGPEQAASKLFPVANEERDWTEAASFWVATIGGGYFTGHLIVAAVRGLLS